MTAPVEQPVDESGLALALAVGEVLSEVEVPTAQAALTRAFKANTTALRTWVRDSVTALWTDLGRWSDESVPVFTDAVSPLLVAARREMAQMAADHLGAQIELARDRRLTLAPRPLPFDVDELALRGVDDATLLRRPFATVWTALSQGKPLPEALAAGLRRADSIAVTDLQLAKTHTAREVLAAEPTVTGYRRVLTGDTTCAKCLLASTRRYWKADLLPIHPGCDCGVEPIIGPDTGPVIDPELAEQVHEIVRADLGEDYVRASGRGGVAAYSDLVISHEHGELGPVLAVRGQAFTGPADIP